MSPIVEPLIYPRRQLLSFTNVRHRATNPPDPFTDFIFSSAWEGNHSLHVAVNPALYIYDVPLSNWPFVPANGFAAAHLAPWEIYNKQARARVGLPLEVEHLGSCDSQDFRSTKTLLLSERSALEPSYKWLAGLPDRLTVALILHTYGRS